MLFQSSIRRELARSFGATFVVLLTIVLTIVLIRTLGQASRGVLNPQDVVLFMGYAALGRLPTILTLSLFIAMVATLTRMYRDSEMVVWFTSGQSLTIFLKPLFRFAWPVLVIIGLTALFVWPWTNQQTKTMQEAYGSRSDIDRIAPGQFQESSNGNRVFFIDRQGKEDSPASNNVFIASTDKGKRSVTTASAGRLEIRGNSPFLLLQNGQRLETDPGKSGQKISAFEEYGTQTGNSPAISFETTDPRLLSVRALLRTPSPSTQAELAWRLGLALGGINFVVLAVALARVNPRGGRSSSLIFVVLAFIAYNNAINLGITWVTAEKINVISLLLVLHGGVLLAGLAWLAKRDSNWTFSSTFQRRLGPVAVPTKGTH